jgi:type VI secretion system protein ImpJ
MRQLQPVIWAKGTFLNPQHLQAQDRFLESTLQFGVEALHYCPWGFRELSFNEEALADGNLAISRASGMFPDGLAFDIPDSDAAPPAKPFRSFFDADQQSLDLYLAIPNLHERGLNVSTGKRGADARYLAELVAVRDENTGTTEKSIQMARKNFRILTGAESREGSTTLRIARVKRSAGGMFQFDPRMVPPLLDLAANEHLTLIIRRLAEILAAKSSILAGNRRQRSQGRADFTASDIANFWLLYTVNSHFPLLRHIYETKKGHPEGAFCVLNSLAGALTTFSLKIQPRDLPLYNHDELAVCFDDLDEKLRLLLETVESNFVSLPLKLVQPFIYATTIDDDKYLVGTRMYLAIASENDGAELIKKVNLIKVASATQIDQLVRQALPGILLSHMPKPPAAIPVKLNYQYFSLNQSGAAWEGIGKARSLATYVPADIKNPQIELVILLPQPS